MVEIQCFLLGARVVHLAVSMDRFVQERCQRVRLAFDRHRNSGDASVTEAPQRPQEHSKQCSSMRTSPVRRPCRPDGCFEIVFSGVMREKISRNRCSPFTPPIAAMEMLSRSANRMGICRGCRADGPPGCGIDVAHAKPEVYAQYQTVIADLRGLKIERERGVCVVKDNHKAA